MASGAMTCSESECKKRFSDVKDMSFDELEKFNTQVIGEIPIEPAVREGGDAGKPVVFFKPESETAKRYQESARKLWAEIEKVNAEGGANNEAIQPTVGLNGGASACSTGGSSSGGCGH